ncbi:Flp family type IVb pilin [Novosphingobium sp.]|uniref:Flp family type IVb pilin n=1 Tax=Novosphingobium sp. TaxID=1874826 RepID=UPI001D577DD0|nr:Flp family type IVb pilin [Novosphingobium sp.]MBX9662688.1 Flp family type IVb pilin [Novosphingobium sp.]
MWDYVRKPLVDDTGATAIEYGLLIGVIAMTMFIGMNAFVNSLHFMYNTIDTNLVKAKK